MFAIDKILDFTVTSDAGQSRIGHSQSLWLRSRLNPCPNGAFLLAASPPPCPETRPAPTSTSPPSPTLHGSPTSPPEFLLDCNHDYLDSIHAVDLRRTCRRADRQRRIRRPRRNMVNQVKFHTHRPSMMTPLGNSLDKTDGACRNSITLSQIPLQSPHIPASPTPSPKMASTRKHTIALFRTVCPLVHKYGTKP